jgi:hypothetical protein
MPDSGYRVVPLAQFEAMDNCVEIAWQTLLACRPMRENHRALFNPMDECWRFSDSPIDHYYPI